MALAIPQPTMMLEALLTPLLNFVPRSVEELDDPFKHEGVEFWLS